jgi:hypothetical protein
MNWKTRKLFSDREHGIVSGLSPINMTGGGNVPYPSYEFGTGPEEAMAIDLFQQGDEEINEPLNMMAQAVSPSLSDIGPTEIVEEAVTMDQGPITETVEEISIEEGPSEYQVELQALKETFKDEIRSYVVQAGTTDLEKYLQRMDVVYNNQLNKLKNKHDITEALPEDILLTEDFIAELVGSSGAEIPGFEEGIGPLTQPQLDALFGKGRMPLERWKKLNPKEQGIWLSLADVARLEQDPASASSGLDMTELNRLLEERRGLAGEIGEAARSGYSSIQDPVSHFFSARKAGKTAELVAREKMIADEINLQKSLLTSQSRSGGIGGLDFDIPAAVSTQLAMGDLVDKKETQEMLAKQWNDFIKPKPGQHDFDWGEALFYFMKGSGNKFPPQLNLTERKVFVHPTTEQPSAGNLKDYYLLVLQHALRIEDLGDREEFIVDTLNEWNLLRLEK